MLSDADPSADSAHCKRHANLPRQMRPNHARSPCLIDKSDGYTRWKRSECSHRTWRDQFAHLIDWLSWRVGKKLRLIIIKSRTLSSRWGVQVGVGVEWTRLRAVALPGRSDHGVGEFTFSFISFLSLVVTRTGRPGGRAELTRPLRCRCTRPHSSVSQVGAYKERAGR